MSIVFIFSGMLLMASSFELVQFKSKSYKIMFKIMAIANCLSFFFGNIQLFNFSFNIFSLLAIVILLILTYRQLTLQNILSIVFVVLAYKVIIDISLDYLVSFDSSLAIAILLIFSLGYVGCLWKGILFILISSVLISIISGVVSLDAFGYACLDFLFMFETIIYYLMFAQICQCVKYNLKISKRRICCEKKFASISSTSY